MINENGLWHASKLTNPQTAQIHREGRSRPPQSATEPSRETYHNFSFASSCPIHIVKQSSHFSHIYIYLNASQSQEKLINIRRIYHSVPSLLRSPACSLLIIWWGKAANSMMWFHTKYVVSLPSLSVRDKCWTHASHHKSAGSRRSERVWFWAVVHQR